ncbi:MAG: SH3 domain-containing protein [Chloroflexota bacterium]|nr:SH3 domain-containing protein [Chloroflexota bacterium]
MPNLLIAVLCAVLFLLNIVIKTLLRKERVGFIDLLLALVAAVAFVALLTDSAAQENSDTQTTQFILLLGLAIVGIGAIMKVVEWARGWKQFGTRGMLGIGTGALIALSTFSIPMTAETFIIPTPTPIRVAQAAPQTDVSASSAALATNTPRATVASADAVSTDTINGVRTPTPTHTPTLTLTSTPRPSATVTATRWTFATRTPLPTATLVTPCLGSVDNNLRLRSEPDREAETLLVIPFATTVMIYGRNEASTWWYTDYEGQQGWVDGEFLTLSAACADMPVRPVS